MATPHTAFAIDYASLEDQALAGLALQGHREAFRHIMQRCNQRLFRIARGVVNDDSEAEDVVQEAYVHAFEKLDTFRGDAMLLTWLTRIVLNEAYDRLRQQRNTVDVEQIEASQSEQGRILAFPSKFGGEDPAAGAARAQIRRLIERAIDDLPEPPPQSFDPVAAERGKVLFNGGPAAPYATAGRHSPMPTRACMRLEKS